MGALMNGASASTVLTVAREGLNYLIGRLSRAPRPERPTLHPPRGLQSDTTGRRAFFSAVRRLQARLFTCFRGEPSARA